MAKQTSKRSKDPGVVALRAAMGLRVWGDADLAEALEVSVRHVQRNFRDDFSSKSMRIKVNEVFKPRQIFFEGVGEKGFER